MEKFDTQSRCRNLLVRGFGCLAAALVLTVFGAGYAEETGDLAVCVVAAIPATAGLVGSMLLFIRWEELRYRMRKRKAMAAAEIGVVDGGKRFEDSQ